MVDGNSDGNPYVDGLTLPSKIAPVMGQSLEPHPRTPKKSSGVAAAAGEWLAGTVRLDPRRNTHSPAASHD